MVFQSDPCEINWLKIVTSSKNVKKSNKLKSCFADVVNVVWIKYMYCLGNTTGNPGVSRANPYPYPSNPYPTSCGWGFCGYGYRVWWVSRVIPGGFTGHFRVSRVICGHAITSPLHYHHQHHPQWR